MRPPPAAAASRPSPGAAGAALIAMVGRLTIGKKGSTEAIDARMNEIVGPG